MVRFAGVCKCSTKKKMFVCKEQNCHNDPKVFRERSGQTVLTPIRLLLGAILYCSTFRTITAIYWVPVSMEQIRRVFEDR